jgi:putative ABC transport system ATP-binding protein
VTPGAPRLEARDLARKVQVDGAERTLIDDFSFVFDTGLVYSILGPSGAGKTSLLRLFNRLDEPTSGEVLFDGEDYRTIAPCTLRKRVGYLFQVPFLFPGTVADNLQYGNEALQDHDIARLLELASISLSVKTQSVENLSVGEKQRVALARLLATDPKVVLLDEPTAALDPTYTEKIEATVRQIASEENLTVIMVSHSPEQALRMGGQAMLLVTGKLIEHGPVEQVIRNPQTDLGRRYRDRELT